MGLDKKKTIENFYKKISKIKDDTIELLEKIKIKNKTVIGYGASTKGNVLLQYYGLNNKQIPLIADRNPYKFGRYTPGTKIKIVSEKVARKLKPDYFFVLPWHFRKEILKRENKLIKKGTKFIFPLPKLRLN